MLIVYLLVFGVAHDSYMSIYQNCLKNFVLHSLSLKISHPPPSYQMKVIFKQ